VKKIVISIVTWNSANTISDCLKSVLSQTFSDFILFVVDNNSTDKTIKNVESFDDPRLIFEKKKENTGFCGGHNYTIRNSTSEYVLLVNPDVILSSNYVENALKAAVSDNRIGTVCGLLLQNNDFSSDDNLIDSAGMDIQRSRVLSMRFHNKKKGESDLKQEFVFGADGALPLYRREMIDDISYKDEFFDELFFAHKEDWDVSWRANIFGWKTIFSPNCIAIHPRHFKPSSLRVRRSISNEIKVHSVKNQLILLLKNEQFSTFLTNGIFILPRQFFIFFYILIFERSSLRAYKIVMRNLPLILRKRRVIQGKRMSKENNFGR
jgi:GT2 family glycosyltransferase